MHDDVGGDEVVSAGQREHGGCRKAGEDRPEVANLVGGEMQHHVLGAASFERGFQPEEQAVDLGLRLVGPAEDGLTRVAFLQNA